MTVAGNGRFGIQRQRGFWLRYFLGIGSILATMFAVGAHCSGQIVVLKPLHVSRVRGYVLTETGAPLPGVQVALASGAQPSKAVFTDANGYFVFPEAKGEYLLHVRIPGSQSANRQVIVGTDLRTWFHRKPLYIMMRPGLCDDCTSPIFTSRKQFDHAVRKMNEKND